ncbi:hypothetical protein V3H18_12590 [Methylocystis sp. 9N]|uniref:ATP-binding protein n=1 Tax=Methylocystis borbori TaxID=3118750 RepID=A0ABU7XJR4_9HYPH
MFEITGDDIAALGDTDLRKLIGLLCEAEMRRRGLPSSGVTWGGDQNAKDGGLDVRVSLAAGTAITGFVPNPQTGFQVKKPDMPRADILDEMKPSSTGVLRPIILELANTSGAYIIVSSNGSTSETALKNRRDAMAEALKGTLAETKLMLDFYDRNRVATWVRDHVGLIPWVRARIGKALSGWQSYGSWSLTPAGIDASYLADKQARIRTGDKDEGDGFSAVDGINHIRKVLALPGHVARLVGLSGVGKTRLAEALFDAAVGEGALDPSLAIYTNEADEPNPPPAGLASDLIANRTRAILVVDNCTPELHRRLSEVARAAGSTISVITIEYDIREDQPEGTDVFALDTSSIPLIEKLVARRYPDLSQVDAQKIAEFSGGNARVALALASQIEKAETVAGLSEEELFKRLFQQRHYPDPSLLSIAQSCSLIYSFEGESLTGDHAELPVLGSLIGKTAEEVYAGVAELKQRDLVQARAQWRAVLPHAIANRLAKMALRNIPPAKIKSILVDNALERVLRSFSRRLGYLDDSSDAKTIVKGWLAPSGLLGDVTNFNELGQAMFANIAPTAPEAVLAALENAFARADENTLHRGAHFARLLRSLAYDPMFFERAIALLVKFALLPNHQDRENEAAEIVKSLFFIVLSGTHAPIEARVKEVERLLGSPEARARLLGVKALQALMKTSYFSSHYEFDFGARSRDYGYYPKTQADVRAWFDTALKLARTFALSDRPAAEDVKKAIAQNFREFWSNAGLADELDRLAREIAAKSFWRDGWIATRQTRTFDGEGMTPELHDRLMALEEFLRPKDLANKVRSLVISRENYDFDDLDDDKKVDDPGARYEANAGRLAAMIQALGHDVAVDDETFKTLLPELLNNPGRLEIFGKALAEGAESPRTMWDAIVAQFVSSKKAGSQLLGGFLIGLQKRDEALADTILDETLENPTLAEWFPVLQANVPINERAVARLLQALKLENAPIKAFRSLAYGRVLDDLAGPEFRDLVVAILSKPEGCAVGLEIISLRFYSDASANREPLTEVREAGRIVLSEFTFARSTAREDHELAMVIRGSLVGPEGIPVSRSLCRKFLSAAAKHEVSVYDFDAFMKGLLQLHPVPILDELFSGDAESCQLSVEVLSSLRHLHHLVLDVVPDEVLLQWCDRDPALRYPLTAAVATLFRRPKAGESHEWTPLTPKLLEQAPDPKLVLKEIIRRLYPSSWSGSLATKLEGRLKLLSSLPCSPALAAQIAAAKADLEVYISNEHRRELEEDRGRNNRFE